MKYKVVVETAGAELVATVRTSIRTGDVSGAWKPALDQVWDYLRTSRELRPGHNVFLDHHVHSHDDTMLVGFGVQIARPFDRHGDVIVNQANVLAERGLITRSPSASD